MSSGFFCLNCNQLFARASEYRCPECGEELSDEQETEYEDTVLVRESTPRATGGTSTPAEPTDEFEERLGTQLHVYQLEVLLGAGGMGRVYLAKHDQLLRRCALKVLSPKSLRGDIDYIDRFQEEGRAAAQLVHPNIVTTHAIGENRGFHFLEMEYVAGGTLRQLLIEQVRFPPVRATVLMSRIADGLAHAHRHGTIHRDLKPDNVLITLGGVPKITDFGLAKRVKIRDPLAQLLTGTPTFMAPELFQGRPHSPASDIYALGVTYYLLLTGRLPFVGRSLKELADRVVREKVPCPREIVPEIPLEISECVLHMLEKTPENRPRNAIEAAQNIAAVAGESRDIESLLREAFAEMPHVAWTTFDGGYTLQVPLPEGRGQTVYVEPSPQESAVRLLTIYSPCCAADANYYEDALRLNAEIAHGGVAIKQFEGSDMFCVIDNYPRATVDPEEVRRSVMEVAHRADAIERLLTNRDYY
ncbi:serine/threonine-protein kinase [Calycomorphotria hydatis]|nr:serine/threonine-protein kinase [Calycomorphotria hydatis]